MIAVIAQLVEHFLGKEEVTSSNLVNSSIFAVIAQLVEHFLGKEEVTSSNLVNSSIFAVIAQLVEHFLGKEEVTSSNLVNSSKKHGTVFVPCFFVTLLQKYGCFLLAASLPLKSLL